MSEDFKSVAWPGWETIDIIGRGSFGAVYKIERRMFNETEKAALKVISIPQNNGDIEELYSDGYDNESITSTFQSHLESIVAEYSLMRKMNGSANIVNCDDVRYVQHDDGIGWDIFIKMELLTPLTKALPAEVSDETVIKIAKDMCRALILCKKHGIIHRDIKPQNIFVSEHGDYKLGDFGIAKTVDKTSGGTKIGTYKYMAPEVYNNQPYGSVADIYSLGLVLYWLLNKRRMPFLPLPPSKLTAGQDEIARNRRFSGEAIPEPVCGCKELKRIVLKACAYKTESRYSSADLMLEDLDRLTGDQISHSDMISQGNSDTTCQEDVTMGPNFSVFNPNAKEKDIQQNTVYDEPVDDATMGPSFEVFKPNIGEKGSQQNAISNEPVDDATMGPSFEVFKPNIGEKGSQQNAIYDESVDDATIGPVFNSDQIGTEKRDSSEEKQNKRSMFIKYAIIALGAIVAIILIIFLLRSCSGRTLASTDGTINTQEITHSTAENTADDSVEGNTGASQLNWSNWLDELPANVAEANYDIEEQTVYRSRTLETTSSTTQDGMEGWELYQPGDYGPWSSWSTQEVTDSETRDVESQVVYRYRSKETATSSSPTKNGWELYNTTYSWSDYGNWSEWSTTAVSKNESRNVEEKLQYCYRDVLSYSTGYSEWSGWSSWQDTFVSETDLVDVETRLVYPYYYFSCRNCGTDARYPFCGSTIKCDSCGKYSITGPEETIEWFETPWSASQYWLSSSKYGESKYYQYINDKIYWNWTEGNPKTQYCYRTRTTKEVPNYNSWSAWGDTAYSSSSTREVATQKVYRYQDRTSVPTYHFWRWGNWSGWSIDPVDKTDERDIETATGYRYRDKTIAAAYYFRRWSEWSEFSTTIVSSSETVEVESKTQYRYKLKDN